MKTCTKFFEENGYYVVATVKQDEVVAKYEIYEAEVWCKSDGEKIIGFQTQIGRCTSNLSEAVSVITMDVKWDGCSNWIHNDFLRGHYAHACSREQLVNLGLILAACWDWTKEILPAWDSTLNER